MCLPFDYVAVAAKVSLPEKNALSRLELVCATSYRQYFGRLAGDSVSLAGAFPG
jgi:hypothetical protein